ncbi:hypothetical protein PSKAS_50320 [Peribacillus sp. N1]
MYDPEEFLATFEGLAKRMSHILFMGEAVRNKRNLHKGGDDMSFSLLDKSSTLLVIKKRENMCEIV